ncbi:hydantoinase/oxoprolinase family protein [bacterium]|nr:hydantoinase/oxoprolinase family protein [bacterium]
MTKILVGVDVGGTFTDFVVADPKRGWLRLKRPTSRPDPSPGILAGLQELEVTECVLSHGTTAATNVALERKGPRTALVTTAGFGDLLRLGRGERLDLYALLPPERPTLVPPELCLEVDERIDASGQVLRPLSLESCQQLVHQLKMLQVEAVAVCLLFAYQNPVHELLLDQVLRESGWQPALSHRVDPQPKEYERASTTVLQAYVAPSLDRYLANLSQQPVGKDLWVVRSSGSVCRPQQAVDRAVGCLLSGPAAGLQGAWRIAQGLGIQRLMTVDVGGTSSDVALCDGQLPYLDESSLGGLPFRCPQVDIHTVGAGGGSMASLDAGGLLQVGPQSAGSQPGPAAYGQGGPATVTDALLLLGRLPQQLAGGRLCLRVDASRQALQALADPLGLPLLEVAAAVVTLAEHNMGQALRLISLERGYDPRQFVLMAYGGGGGSHAAALAQMLGIRRVLVPAQPGLLCAQGAMLAPWQAELQHSWARPYGPELVEELREWKTTACAQLRRAAPDGRVEWATLWEVRYQGQGSSLWLAAGPNLEGRFERLHQRRFGYQRPGQPLEVVSSLVRARVQRADVAAEPVNREPLPPPREEEAYWGLPPVGGKIMVYADYPGPWIAGPARLDRMDGTLWLPPNWRARMAPDGSLTMESLASEEEHEE